MRFRLVTFCCVALMSTVAAAQSDELIVPGQRIGPVSLGMTKAEVYRQMGDPDLVVFGSYRWKGDSGNTADGISVRFDSNDAAAEICGGGSYATTSGVRHDMSEMGVEAELGAPVKVKKYKMEHLDGVWGEDLYYPGLHITLSASGDVRGFRVGSVCVTR